MRALLLSVVAGLSLVACSSGDTPATPSGGTPTAVVAQSGDGQTGSGGDAVSVAPSVLVRDAAGRPVSGVTVQFTVAEGGGTLEGASPVSNADGIAAVTRWTLGSGGVQRLRAVVGSLPPVSFTASLQPGSAPVTLSVPASGGTVAIVDDGHPFKGLRLTVPNGAYAAASDWRVRVTPNVTLPTMPTGYSIVGPPLEISSEQGFADRLMTLEVPFPRVANREAVLALYDPVRRVLEAMPTVARTDSTIRVMTGHLRGDLLAGRTTAAGTRKQFGSPQMKLVGIGSLVKIELLLPQLAVPPVPNESAWMWPVRDAGTALFPKGLSLELARLQSIAVSQVFAGYSSAVRILGVSMYADAAPLSAATLLHAAQSGVLQNLGQLQTALGALPKPERDELVQRNITAQLALTGIPTVIGLLPEGAGVNQGLITFANAFGSPPNQLTLRSSTLGVITLERFAAAGFIPLSMLPTVDATPIPASSALLTNSFIADVAKSASAFSTIAGLAGLAGEQRHSYNLAAAISAGLPVPTLEYEAVAGGGWIPVDSAGIVARTGNVLLRITSTGAPAIGGAVIHHGVSGAELVRSSATTISIGTLPAFTALPELESVPWIFSTLNGGTATSKQVMVVTRTITRAKFAITPAESRLSASNLRVTVEAPVNRPPAGGYRIKWDWGDGTTTENTNVAAATHDYTRVGRFQVKATLRAASGTTILAEATANVVDDAAAQWIITSFADQDSLFKFGAPGSGNSLITVLQRLLSAPRAGLISVDSTGPGTRTLRVRVKPDALWAASGCCALPAPNEVQQTLGVDPSVPYVVGPYFAGFNRDFWTQSSADLGTGTMTGQALLNLATFDIEGVGRQTGPAGAVRFSATRNGTAMAGTITVLIWPVDLDNGFVDPVESYRFPFTATRVR